MLVVVASYRQNVHAYPSGGGDYEVTTTNFSPRVGMTVASALMVDYTLTVAVSVSSGVANLASDEERGEADRQRKRRRQTPSAAWRRLSWLCH